MSAAVSGVFDKVDAQTFRFLDEASRIGPLTVYLWSDALAKSVSGSAPKFTLEERVYVMDALRYVGKIEVLDDVSQLEGLPKALPRGSSLAVLEKEQDKVAAGNCEKAGVEYRVVTGSQLEGFPEMDAVPTKPGGPDIVVTGCYDWFHSGHVRFFEEVSEFGNLHVVVGHDANVRMLKGEGHPMFEEKLRRYMAQSIRFVTQAYVSSGSGWMDAEPEIGRIKPDIYAVNEDGDKPEKAQFCKEHGLEYMVLKREPKPGLPRRSSTDLRGF